MNNTVTIIKFYNVLQHLGAKVMLHGTIVVTIPNNVETVLTTLSCAKNRRCKSSRVSSPLRKDKGGINKINCKSKQALITNCTMNKTIIEQNNVT